MTNFVSVLYMCVGHLVLSWLKFAQKEMIPVEWSVIARWWYF